MKAAEASSRVFEDKARVKTKITNIRHNVHHTCKKKNARYFEKNYLTWPPTAPHLWSRCQHGFLLHFSLHLYTERIDSWLQWVSGTAGSGDGISGWFSGISRSCMYFCWSPSLVPLFPCQTTFDKRVKKMDASKSRWHLLSCYGDVLGGMERFGAILDSRDDILEWRLANLSGNPVLCHRSPQCFPCSCLALWWKPVCWIEVARIP